MAVEVCGVGVAGSQVERFNRGEILGTLLGDAAQVGVEKRGSFKKKTF